MLNPSNRRGTDPYARWCGRGGIARCPPIPIDRASTVLRLSWRHCTTTVSRGVIAAFFSLDHWWEVPFLHRRVRSELLPAKRSVARSTELQCQPEEDSS